MGIVPPVFLFVFSIKEIDGIMSAGKEVSKMALFKEKESKEEKQERKELEMMQKYGLDELTDPRDRESVKKIVSELVGTGLMETGMKLAMTNAGDQLKVSYLRATMEQNFIIIRQLEKLNKLLDK